ncbi:hypothetical protein GC177_06245 [bacterium]|nr:hypothetical protein [bacterium]
MIQLSEKQSLIAMAVIALIAATALYWQGPIPQDPAYHDFADKRAFYGIPNFGDVAGNLAFILVGCWGLAMTWRRQLFQFRGEKYIWYIFFAGTALVGFGSSYYHLTPGNATLVWDRLPMTIAFMALFSYLIMERIDATAGIRFFPSLILLGIGSVWYWDYTESLGRGDVRPYAFIQFFPMLVIPFLLLCTRPRYTGSTCLYFTLGWYAASKLLEHFDHQLFALTDGTVSGHTLKHLAAAMGVAFVVQYIRQRQPVVTNALTAG